MNGSGLTRFGIGAVVAMCALPGVAWADSSVLNPTGALTFTWHGSASRGCQAAGVCGVSGSIDVIPDDQSGASESPPSGDVEIDDASAVARVADPGSTPGDPHVCTDLVRVEMTFSIARAKHGGLEARNRGLQAPPSSGRCAGPVAIDLGSFGLPARRLAGRTEAYSLAGKRTFGAGPYEVTVTSTIRARRARPTGIGGNPFGIGSSSGSSPKPKRGLLESVDLVYRLSIGGSLTTSFAGRPDPFCVPLDACGASGSVTESPSQDSIPRGGNVLEIDAQRVVHHVVSRARALADLHSGRLTIESGGEPLIARSSARVSFPDGTLCTDLLRQDGLAINADMIDHRRELSLALSSEPDLGDPVRTHCPGPSSLDTTLNAHASTPIRTLGDHSLRFVLSAMGRFVSGSYAGVHSGSVSVDLALERVRAGTEHTVVFPGEP